MLEKRLTFVPLNLCNSQPAQIREMERQQRREQKQQDVLFFREMERNILISLKRGQRIPCCDSLPQLARHQSATTTTSAAPATSALPRSRTLSGMDEVLLQQFSNPALLKQPQPHGNHTTASKPRDAHGRPPLNPLSMGRVSIATTTATATTNNGASLLPFNFSEMSMEFSPELVERKHPLTRDDSGESELRGVALLDGPLEDDDALCDVVDDEPKNQLQQQHVRRNTGGTIYMKTTMMNPDIKATIKVSEKRGWLQLYAINSYLTHRAFVIQCVCGVYRAHILQASSKRSGKSPVSVALTPNESLADVFLDHCGGNEIPSLDEVVCFYQDFYLRSQMEHDTIIMSLIYVERLIKEDTSIAPLPENWRSVLFSCMVLASKVWDDLSMWNIDFSNVCGRGGGLTSYTLSRINELELALLKALNFNVKVPASEYAKYYFLIRSMLFKSGLLLPADRPMNCQQQVEKSSHRTTKSMDDYGFVLLDQSVCLEQLLSQTTY